MRRRTFLGLLALAATRNACAAAPSKRARVGVVGLGSAATGKIVLDALRQGLAALGYVEGENLTFEVRHMEGDPARAAPAVAELIAAQVDVIVTAGEAVYAARRVTATVPIVMAGSGDIVAEGYAQSLAHPGGNVTGTIALPRGVLAKRLGLFRQIVPGLRRAGVFLREGQSLNASWLDNLAGIAGGAGVELQPFEVSDAAGYEAALATAAIDGFFITESGQFFQDAPVIAALALKHRQPTIGASVMAKFGLLVGYSPDPLDMWRNAARFVDQIVRGAKPGDIPIEQATKFATVVNLKTAKGLGLTIPPDVLAAADEVIE